MTARAFPVLAATVALLGVVPATASQVGTCPCPVFQDPSRDCQDCHRVRCRIGGWEIHRQCSDASWCFDAAKQWVKNCNAYTGAAPWTSMKTACTSVMDVCGLVCGKLFPPQQDCSYRCLLAQGAAAHNCLSFPWPDPPATPSTTSALSFQGPNTENVYT
mmetsp:Transcript_51091/g.141483  ORF Transcript_51091/g.141483 Transcript_51091/m.141483 type:complete len:160 (-) Transcript_51091:142-621(-)